MKSDSGKASLATVTELTLLEKSLDFVDKPDIRGRTALHYACASDPTGDVVEALMSLNDGAVVADDEGWTPLHAAAAAGNATAVVKLSCRGTRVRPARGVSSPVYLAARGGHWQLVAALTGDKPGQGLNDR